MTGPCMGRTPASEDKLNDLERVRRLIALYDKYHGPDAIPDDLTPETVRLMEDAASVIEALGIDSTPILAMIRTPHFEPRLVPAMLDCLDHGGSVLMDNLWRLALISVVRCALLDWKAEGGLNE